MALHQTWGGFAADSDNDGLSNQVEPFYGTNPGDSDTDNDGLIDGSETRVHAPIASCGFGGSSPRKIHGFEDLTWFGVSPLRQDLLIEADYQEPLNSSGNPIYSMEPSSDAIDKLEQTYLQLPIVNPDGSLGIHVAFSLDDAIDDASINCDSKFDNYSNFRWGHRYAFRHGCIVAGPGQVAILRGGMAQVGGPMFYVRTTSAPNNNPADDMTESVVHAQWAATLHELGHTSSLRHGGDGDTLNCKPNYGSLMNYSYSYRFNNAPKTLMSSAVRYSPGVLGSIDEASLLEIFPFGFGATGSDYNFIQFYPHPSGGYPLLSFSPTQPGVDWDRNGLPNLGIVSQTVRADCVDNGPPPTSFKTLVDRNDITAIRDQLDHPLPQPTTTWSLNPMHYGQCGIGMPPPEAYYPSVNSPPASRTLTPDDLDPVKLERTGLAHRDRELLARLRAAGIEQSSDKNVPKLSRTDVVANREFLERLAPSKWGMSPFKSRQSLSWDIRKFVELELGLVIKNVDCSRPRKKSANALINQWKVAKKNEPTISDRSVDLTSQLREFVSREKVEKTIEICRNAFVEPQQ